MAIFIIFFTQPQFEAKKFCTRNCVDFRQKLSCLLSSTYDPETHVGGKASIVKSPSCYLFTCLPRDRSVYFIGWPQCCLFFLFKVVEKVWEQVHSGWPQSCFSVCYLQHVTLRRTSVERPRLLSLPPFISSRARATIASRQEGVLQRLTSALLIFPL